MRISSGVLPAMFLAFSFAVPLKAATPEEQAVLAPVEAVFDGIAKRDAAAIQQPLLPGGMLVVIRDGKTTQIAFCAFAERVGNPGRRSRSGSMTLSYTSTGISRRFGSVRLPG